MTFLSEWSAWGAPVGPEINRVEAFGLCEVRKRGFMGTGCIKKKTNKKNMQIGLL